MSDPKRSLAIGYARVSTDEQGRDGVSLEAQVARIRAYAEAKGLNLSDVLVDDGHDLILAPTLPVPVVGGDENTGLDVYGVANDA